MYTCLCQDQAMGVGHGEAQKVFVPSERWELCGENRQKKMQIKISMWEPFSIDDLPVVIGLPFQNHV